MTLKYSPRVGFASRMTALGLFFGVDLGVQRAGTSTWLAPSSALTVVVRESFPSKNCQIASASIKATPPMIARTTIPELLFFGGVHGGPYPGLPYPGGP